MSAVGLMWSFKDRETLRSQHARLLRSIERGFDVRVSIAGPGGCACRDMSSSDHSTFV